MKTELRQLSVHDGIDIYELLQEIPKEEHGYYNNAHGLSYTEYKTWLKKMENQSKGIDLPDWMVPSTEYFFYVNDIPVGNIRIRHYLTDALREHGGHIAYAVSPKHRGKGYGTMMLHAIFPYAKQLGIDQILIDPNPDNVYSRRIIEANGGKLEKETEEHAYYWISL